MMVKKFFAIVCLFSLIFSFSPIDSHGQSNTSLSMQTESTRLLPKTEFVVHVRINHAKELFGYAIDITYQQSLLDLLKIEEGDFFETRGQETVFQQSSDTQTGTIKLASAILGKGNHASGEGVLASLTFKTKFTGNTNIVFARVTLKDPDLNDIVTIHQDLSLTIYEESMEPILQVDPQLLDFATVEFGSQPEKSFRVSNAGKGEIRGEVNSLNPWLRVRPQQFTEATDFVVTVLSHMIPPGASYEGEIRIRSNGGDKSVMVKLTLFQDIKRDPPPLIIMTPDNNMITRETRLFILCETHPEAFASINNQRLSVDSEDGIFYLNTTLKEGVNTFVISVWDAYENRRTESITVTRKTIPPQITVSEVPLFTQEEELQIQGKTEPDASLFFNRQQVQLAKDGSFSVSYQVRNEMNQLIFTAVDTLGNSRTVVRVFFYRPVYPNVIILVLGSNTASFNGRDFTIDAPPILSEGRVMVPIRVIAEIFGADIDWRADTKTVHIALRYDQIVLSPGNKQATVNGQQVLLDAAPLIHQGRLMVPVRFIAETFKSVVGWDQELGQVSIRF